MDGAADTGHLVVGVDGGNSKTHVVVATLAGKPLGWITAGSVVGALAGGDGGAASLRALIDAALERAAQPPGARDRVLAAALCLAGIDLPGDARRIRAALTPHGLAARLVVENDALATLRGGTATGHGIALVCGAGINALGVAADGRRAGFPALGELSGDWGGGAAVGMAALAAAVRSADGRGPATALERLVPEELGLRRPLHAVRAVHRGRLPQARIAELAPLVAAAAQHDPVAQAIVERLADELAGMARAIARRLRLVRTPTEIVLGGGMLGDAASPLAPLVIDRLAMLLPVATPHVLATPPVAGAVLLALDALGGAARSDPREIGRQLATLGAPQHVVV